MQGFHFIHTLPFFLLLGWSSQAAAWGETGHRVIAILAEQNLTGPTRTAVAGLLDGDDLATASTWADAMRSSKDNPEFWNTWAAAWHYADIPLSGDYENTAKHPRGDAWMALETFIAILLGEEVPEGPVKEGLEFYFGDLAARQPEVKRFALRFLLHIVGDLQQPLHNGYAEDRGGNAIELLWFGERSNLHAVWDTHLVEQPRLDHTRLAARLANRIGHTPASDIRRMERIDPAEWRSEAQRILERIHARHDGRNDFGSGYAAEFVPTVEAQLVKGGLRTAFILNNIFGGWTIGAWRNPPSAGRFAARQP